MWAEPGLAWSQITVPCSSAPPPALSTHSLFDLKRPHPATTQELLKFHSEDYVNFLSRVTPDGGRTVANNLQKFNVGEYTDCPVFDGMMEFCKLYTGCSIGPCDGAGLRTACLLRVDPFFFE